MRGRDLVEDEMTKRKKEQRGKGKEGCGILWEVVKEMYRCLTKFIYLCPNLRLMMKNTFFYILLVMALASCKPKENMVYMSTAHPDQQITQAKFLGNQIQEGDQLLILVSGLDDIAVRPFNLGSMGATNSNTSGAAPVTPSEYTVNESGFINFPVLGNVFVKGMTLQQAREDLEERLTRYLTDPMVSVSLKNFNISVLGEVKEPGQHQSTTQKVNVFQALALAGDMTQSGDRTKVKLIRAQEGNADLVVNLDLSSSNITSSPYYYLQQNDILYVEPDKFKQIEANSNPNSTRWMQYTGFALGILTLIITLAR
ncbi:polysaccharide biosynthesis/export family protein [Kaistella sp. PBT33-4]|uniref:polysaccharide biosynthesis/export family protein n=1 Tax=Kaistella sp. PBT33-4 TaxID=3032000 RepID=UPI0023D84C3D|nr:polysaccharide biosynthesis/export family protein [Kaistella sp. PBT33-4]MDF0718765.1 polysaccharide biosynthesis/export family protein [Kaistella sp. PBT33-4]